MVADLEDGHDVGMLEFGGGGGLGQEPGPVSLRGESRLPHDLDGHHPIQRALPGLVNDPHAAPAQFLKDFVVAKRLRRRWRRRGGAEALSGRCRGGRGEGGRELGGGPQRPQFLGQVGMLAGRLLHIGALAQALPFGQIGENQGQAVVRRGDFFSDVHLADYTRRPMTFAGRRLVSRGESPRLSPQDFKWARRPVPRVQ